MDPSEVQDMAVVYSGQRTVAVLIIIPLSRSTWDGEVMNLGPKPLEEEGEWQKWKI